MSDPVLKKAWKGKWDDGRKFRPEWEKKYAWVRRAPGGQDAAFCNLCKKVIAAKVYNLTEHDKSQGHKSHIVCSSGIPSMFPPKAKEISPGIKTAEIQLAAAMACHCAIRSVDHISEIIKSHGQGSNLGQIKLHRTKASKLIQNVIAPSFEEEMLEDVTDQKYSVIVDESTDCGSDKFMCILIRYFSAREAKIATRFLGLAPVIRTTGEALYNALKSKIESKGLVLSNCIGYGSDGAANMIGEHNSLWSRLREDSPNIIQVRCVCHSLALCMKQAFAQLPKYLGFLLSEVPNWFTRSSIRREDFKNLFNVMNAGEERFGVPLPFAKYSTTRWLARSKVINNLLVNWDELHAYFLAAEQVQDMDVQFKAHTIRKMLSNPLNKLYFTFAAPIVDEMERVNAFFQQTDAEPEDMVKELNLYFDALKSRLYDGFGRRRSHEDVDFGARFNMDITKLCGDSNNNNGDPELIQGIRTVKVHCHKLLDVLLDQVKSRIPPTKDLFTGLKKLNPTAVLNQVSRLPFKDLPLPFLMGAKVSDIENQYRKILHVMWHEEECFKDGIPKETVPFWFKVSQYTDMAGDHPFADLAQYCMSCLALPVSNACVERVFSQMNAVKTKARNRLSFPMLEAILGIRTSFSSLEVCCQNMSVSKKMLEKFTSKMYERGSAEDDDNVIATIEMF